MTTPATLLATLARRPASADPDADLLGRFVATADAEAFEELVRRYGSLVWRVARTRCRGDATAEDVFQATFAVLSRKAGTVRTPAALAGWLHLTAHRLAVRATRRERPTVPLPPDLAKTADPLDALTARELLAAVDDELTKLTDAERAVLLLCGIDGISNGEAAVRLGVSSGSVKGRLERARQKLRDRLTARGLTLPAVLVGLIGFAPPVSAVEAAVALSAGGALPPAVAQLLTETFPMKAKAVLAAAVVGLLLLTGGVMTDTGVSPTADAAPVPRDFRPLPKEAWGEAKDGLQAGLRMPAGATLEVSQSKELQVVVRNVGKQARTVLYTPLQPGIGLSGFPEKGRFLLSINAFWDREPPSAKAMLEPGAEFVRWRATVRHAVKEMVDNSADDLTANRIDLSAGTHKLRMSSVRGDVTTFVKDGELTDLDALATGELEVRCVSPRPAPRRNAPVPKDAAKAVLWSAPVRVDWKGSGAERINGVWTPDGKGVIVPTPTANEKGEPIPGGGIDFRDAATGKVTKSLVAFPKDFVTVFQPVKISVEAGGKTAHAAGGQYVPGRVSVVSRDLVTWPDASTDNGGKVDVLSGGRLGLSALSPDGKWLAYTSHDALVEFRDGTPGRLLSATKLEAVKGSRIMAVEFHSTSAYVLIAYNSGVLHAIESDTGKQMGGVGGLGVNIHAVAISPDGKHIAAGGTAAGEKGHALIVFEGGLPQAKLTEPRVLEDAVPAKERINGLAFSADSKHLAAACSDGVLRVFDVAAGKLVTSAKEHKEEIFSVAYSPDGKKLLTIGRDAMKVWDVARLMAK